MPMNNPPHPGRIVRQDCIEPLGLTVTAAAEALGVTRQALNNLVNGTSGISPEMAVRIVGTFGGSAELWLRVQANYDLPRVRRNQIQVRRYKRAAWRMVAWIQVGDLQDQHNVIEMWNRGANDFIKRRGSPDRAPCPLVTWSPPRP
jgi:antitoxin HigA-1